MSCKQGDSVTQRHNDLRNLTTKLLSDVCKDIETEPVLNDLSGEAFEVKTANRRDGARVDVKANWFWLSGLTTFVNIRRINANIIIESKYVTFFCLFSQAMVE